jgi:O-antigen chain-terminating methyltransferase
VRPLPPELLSFAAEFAGFARQLVVRLQEPADVHTDALLGLRHVLEGVSPDYAVVAQKAAAPEIMQRFDAAFGSRYGVSLGLVTHRYDEQAAMQRGALDTAASHGLQALDQLEAVRASVAGLSTHVSGLGARLDARLAEADAVQREFNAVLASRSWRITAPMRAASSRIGRLRAAVRNATLGAAFKWRVKHALRGLGKAVLRSPDAKRVARGALSRFPGLQARLREMMEQAPVAPGAPPPSTQQASDLSPRAQRLYADLKQALDHKET